jgi:hypothetical protein
MFGSFVRRGPSFPRSAARCCMVLHTVTYCHMRLVLSHTVSYEWAWVWRVCVPLSRGMCACVCRRRAHSAGRPRAQEKSKLGLAEEYEKDYAEQVLGHAKPDQAPDAHKEVRPAQSREPDAAPVAPRGVHAASRADEPPLFHSRPTSQYLARSRLTSLDLVRPRPILPDIAHAEKNQRPAVNVDHVTDPHLAARAHFPQALDQTRLAVQLSVCATRPQAPGDTAPPHRSHTTTTFARRAPGILPDTSATQREPTATNSTVCRLTPDHGSFEGGGGFTRGEDPNGRRDSIDPRPRGNLRRQVGRQAG